MTATPPRPAPLISPESAPLGDLLARARRLGLFAGVLQDEVGGAYLGLLGGLASGRVDETQQLAARLFGLLAGEAELYAGPLVGDAWQNHLLDRLLEDDGPFSAKAQRTGPDGLGAGLLALARIDLGTLRSLYELNGAALATLSGAPNELFDWSGFQPLAERPPQHGPAGLALKRQLAATADWAGMVGLLAGHLHAEGAGLFGRYRAFRWTRRGHHGQLEGIAHPDPIRLDELIAYDRERALLIQNTEQFLAGHPANNALLYGDRGTGKSSTVKALLHAYAGRGLRIVELPKHLLADFPSLMATLRERRERFVVFVDDLSFEEHESIYKELKAVLEGGLEARPENVVIYATSNRRHLIVERFSDHDSDPNDEIHHMDTVQEKLSLSDRFGIRLFFLSPDQQRYLEIIRTLAAQRGLAIETADLERRALQWATWQNGRSGRTARQFVDHLTGELASTRE
jgi:predicted AAA+ superfamily ATPase